MNRKVIIASALILLLAFVVVLTARPDMNVDRFVAAGISSAAQARALETHLRRLDGVADAAVKSDGGVTIRFDSGRTNSATIRREVERLGYRVTATPASGRRAISCC